MLNPRASARTHVSCCSGRISKTESASPVTSGTRITVRWSLTAISEREVMTMFGTPVDLCPWRAGVPARCPAQ